MTLGLFLYFADGRTSAGPGAFVGPCETVKYQADLAPGGGSCAFEGGSLELVTPDGEVHDVTPPGGIPKLGGTAGAFHVTSSVVTYVVTSADAMAGTITASLTYRAGKAHLSASDVSGVPAGTTAVNNFIQACPLAGTPCVTFACDPDAADASGIRRGLCSDQMEFQAAGTPCPDADSDPCTSARCDGAGTCEQSFGPPCDDGDPCTTDSCAASVCRNDPIPGCGTCGDGVTNGEHGEECDLGAATNGGFDSCCDANCRLRRPTYICRFAPSECEKDATCERSTDGSCPPGELAPGNTPCQDANPCTTGDHCDGGECRGEAEVCHAEPTVRRSSRSGLPRIVVKCSGTPLQNFGAFCEARARTNGAASAGCAADSSGQLVITKTKRHSLKRNSASLALQLDRCGRGLVRRLRPGQAIEANVQTHLGGVLTDEPDRPDATLNSSVSIGK